MATEQFSLCWDNFHKNMSLGMSSLLESEDLVDVTIGVEGRYIKAHKMVLSVCSPYFRELFKVNPCKHPILILKDVSYVSLIDLLQFMYQGEVQVSQENLSTFIKTAESLQIRGLTTDVNPSFESESEQSPSKAQVINPKPSRNKPRKSLTTPSPLSAKKARIISGVSIRAEATPQKVAAIDNNKPSSLQKSSVTNESTFQPEEEKDPLKIEDVAFSIDSYEQVAQTMSIEEGVEDDDVTENLTDDPMDDTIDEYSIIEDPKPGTSGQIIKFKSEHDQSSLDLNLKNKTIVVNGFTYHQNTRTRNAKVRYLVCSELKKLACKARAQIPTNSDLSEFILSSEHNHPPLLESQIRYKFVKDLRLNIAVQPRRPLKETYDCVVLSHPEATKLCPYKRMAPSMRRWRQTVDEKNDRLVLDAKINNTDS